MRLVDTYRVLARNASANLVGRLAAIALGLVVSTVLFRTLGAVDFGVWSLLVSLVGYSMLLDFGLSAAIERRVAVLWVRGDLEGIGQTLRTALTGTVAVLGGAQLLLLGGLPWVASVPGWSEAAGRGIAVLPVCATMTLAGLITGSGLTGLQRMAQMQAGRVVGLLVGSTGTIGAVLTGVRRLDLLLLTYCAGSLVSAAVQWCQLRRWIPGLRCHWAWDRPTWRDLLTFGGVLQVATMVPPLAEYVFRLVMGTRFGLGVVGAYDLAGRAAITLRSLAGSLFAAMVPSAVQAVALAGPHGGTMLVRVAVRYTALFVLPGSALLLVQAPTLVDVWLGDVPGARLVLDGFRVMLVAHAFGSIWVPIAMLGRAAGRPSLEAGFTVMAFSLGALAAAAAPSWVRACAVFWGVPALAGFALWFALNRVLGVRFESGRELLSVSVCAVLAGAVGLAGEWSLRAVGWPLGLGSLLVVSGAGVATVAVAAGTTGLVDPRALAGLASGLHRQKAPTGTA